MKVCLACMFVKDVSCWRCDKSYCHHCFMRDVTTGLKLCTGHNLDPEILTYHSFEYSKEFKKDNI